MSARRIIVVGGGAAGFFAAITCAEAKPDADVTILEKSSRFLSKVRISGGGRCNVTHACFDAREFATRFPRGEQPLIGPLKRFQAKDTVAWFAARGVKLKTESDGRMFPVTDSSETIIDCLIESAKAAGVKLVTNCGVQRLSKHAEGGFDVTFSTGKTDECDRVLLATGGCRTAAAGQLAVSLGHTLEPPVPSLFTFHIVAPWLRKLAGISVGSAELSIPGTGLRERGAVLVTHSGLSGPAILRLSAWGARQLHDRDYQFPLHLNWLPHLDAEQIASESNARREQQPARLVVNTPIAPLPARLWEQLVLASGVAADTRWSRLTRAAQHRLIQQLTRTDLAVTGKSLNKDEFVTCGGVRLREVDFKTMESRLCPGLYFAGELLDIDGITGGFNFQAAWTTGWIAGAGDEYNPAVIEPDMLLTAYRRGIFPMAVDKRGRIGWFSPDPRAVIPLDAHFHIPHGLRRALKQKKFEITTDTDFETVIRECSKRREGTWISPGIIDSYCNLQRLGSAHSVETRLDGKLVGGLYGVSVGGAFFGESMFHRATDASKVALVALVERLRARGFVLLDTQWTTPHLQQFGTCEIPRHEYLWRLEHALKLECKF